MQIMQALLEEHLAGELDPTALGGLPDDGLAERLGVSEEALRPDRA
jgi:hypothetical protein